jgi:hypothetical protein
MITCKNDNIDIHFKYREDIQGNSGCLHFYENCDILTSFHD